MLIDPSVNEWGSDSLSHAIEDTFENTRLSYKHLRTQYRALLEIHQLFEEVRSNLDRSKPPQSLYFVGPTHNLFIASSHLALSGQTLPLFPTLRACIEFSLYAFKTSKDPNSTITWLNRHEGEEQRRKLRKTFVVPEIIQDLRQANPKIGEVTGKLYELTIDWGAHPNVYGTLLGVSHKSDGKTVVHKSNTAGEPEHLFGIKIACDVGICCLQIIEQVFQSRFRILDLDRKLEELAKRMPKYRVRLTRSAADRPDGPPTI